MSLLFTYEKVCRSILNGFRIVSFCFLLVTVMLFGHAPMARADDVTVTIYFGGTGLPSTWWKSQKPLGAFWWTNGLSRFNQPHLLALMHEFQDTSDANQWKYFVPGVGAYPQCTGDPLCPLTMAQEQQQYPHATTLYAAKECLFIPWWRDPCWNWEQSLNRGLAHLDERLKALASGDRINLIALGNSRGAITTMWFLHEIVNKYDADYLDEKIRSIHIIAMDPVPGVNMLSNNYGDIDKMGGEAVFKLNGRLTNYVGIYARDERSRKFGPLIPLVDSTRTKELMYGVRGSHETLVGSHQLNGHSVVSGVMSQSDEDGDVKSVNDLVAVTAVELMSSPEWGNAKFYNGLLKSVYPGGRSVDESANKAIWETHIKTMNSAEDNGVDWELMRKRSFIPFGLFESFYGTDCHDGATTNPHDNPRCTLYLYEGEPGQLEFAEIPLLIPLIEEGQEAEDVWHTMYLMRMGDDDMDGVANHSDNCPTTENTDQADTDRDGKGDVCELVAVSGGPYEAKCTGPEDVEIQLDGSGSYDADPENEDKALRYDWWASIQHTYPPHYVAVLWDSIVNPFVQLAVGEYSLRLYVLHPEGPLYHNGIDDTTISIYDEGTPDISCPGNISQECTRQNGEPIEFEATASDDCDVEVVLSCDLVSGTAFPVGETAVTCSAVDASANETSCKFTVEIQDTTSPVINGDTYLAVEKSSRMNFETLAIADLVTSVEDICDEVTMDDLSITGVSRSAPSIGYCLSDLRDPLADFEIAGDGKSVELRSDPCGRNGNRVYTVDITLVDDSGNATTRPFRVEMLSPSRG